MHDPRSVLSREAPPPVRIDAYGPGEDRTVDLWPGRTPGAPLVVLLHGGFWRPEIDRHHVWPLANALVSAGLSVAVPEYRRVGWPGMFDDVAMALDRLPSLVRRHGLRPAHVTWAGHSAGGHLALWASLRHHLPDGCTWHLPRAPEVRKVVALAACSDLIRCVDWELDGDAALAMMHGAPREHPERYSLADPAARLPQTVPAVLVHGTLDDRVPIAMSRDYARAPANWDAPVTLKELPGIEHFGLIDPLSPAYPEVLAAIME